MQARSSAERRPVSWVAWVQHQAPFIDAIAQVALSSPRVNAHFVQQEVAADEVVVINKEQIGYTVHLVTLRGVHTRTLIRFHIDINHFEKSLTTTLVKAQSKQTLYKNHPGKITKPQHLGVRHQDHLFQNSIHYR